MRWDVTGGMTGFAYDDANGNGVRDHSDLPLPGWRVYYDRNGNGRFNRGEPFDFADEDGAYGLPAYPDGLYALRLSTPDDHWTSTVVAAPVRRGRTTWRDVSAARVTPAFSSVTGNVYREADFDGVFDAGRGDRAVGGVRVYLDLNRNGRYTSGEPADRTDGNGNCRIDEVLPGRYRLAVVEFGQGHEYMRDAARILEVRAGTVKRADVPFGYDPARSVMYGVVFHDRDVDGVQDDDEPGLAGIEINVVWNGPVLASQTVSSDSRGYYQVTGLTPGQQVLSVTDPSGEWDFTSGGSFMPILAPGEALKVLWGFRRRA